MTEWLRIASHAIGWGCWRISKAECSGETIYTLWQTFPDEEQRSPRMVRLSRELDELKALAQQMAEEVKA